MDELYERDLVQWSEQQAQALRAAATAGWNAPIDWTNVAEEIESLGRSQRHVVASRIGLVIEHLWKLQASLASDPVHGWRDTVRRSCREIDRLLPDSPSLRRALPRIVADEVTGARALAAANLRDYDEHPLTDLATIVYDEAQLRQDWWPAA